MKDIGLALDRTQPLPLYYQTYEVLVPTANGIWKAGDFLPQFRLASRFSVSVVTIRQALDRCGRMVGPFRTWPRHLGIGGQGGCPAIGSQI